MTPAPAEWPIDLARALAVVGGDRELLRELAEVFLGDLPGQTQELHEALRLADAPRTQRAAHGLKGALANLGAAKASSLALELEGLGRTGRLDLAPAALSALDAEIARLRAFLEARGWDQPD